MDDIYPKGKLKNTASLPHLLPIKEKDLVHMNLKTVNRKYIHLKKKSLEKDFNSRQDNFNKNDLDPILSTGKSDVATPTESMRKKLSINRSGRVKTGFKTERDDRRELEFMDKQLVRKALARQEQILEELAV